jgi:hypothetical protein
MDQEAVDSSVYKAKDCVKKVSQSQQANSESTTGVEFWGWD